MTDEYLPERQIRMAIETKKPTCPLRSYHYRRPHRVPRRYEGYCSSTGLTRISKARAEQHPTHSHNLLGNHLRLALLFLEVGCIPIKRSSVSLLVKTRDNTKHLLVCRELVPGSRAPRTWPKRELVDVISPCRLLRRWLLRRGLGALWNTAPDRLCWDKHVLLWGRTGIVEVFSIA